MTTAPGADSAAMHGTPAFEKQKKVFVLALALSLLACVAVRLTPSGDNDGFWLSSTFRHSTPEPEDGALGVRAIPLAPDDRVRRLSRSGETVGPSGISDDANSEGARKRSSFPSGISKRTWPVDSIIDSYRSRRSATSDGGNSRVNVNTVADNRFLIRLTHGLSNRLRTILGFKLIAVYTEGTDVFVNWEPDVRLRVLSSFLSRLTTLLLACPLLCSVALAL